MLPQGEVSFWRYVGKGASPFEYGKIYVWGKREFLGGEYWEQVTKEDWEKQYSVKKEDQPNGKETR
jgi:monoamine oxidase